MLLREAACHAEFPHALTESLTKSLGHAPTLASSTLIGHALIVTSNLSPKGCRVKFVVPLFALLAPVFAAAAPPQEYCDALGTTAQRFAQDRNNGISYKEQRGRIQRAAVGTADPQSTLKLFDGVARTVYIDMPQLTPEGAYKFVRVACMTAP